jgi:hypothetical protein
LANWTLPLLDAFLADNNFPEDITANAVFNGIANGDLKPEALHDYLTDGNKALFEAEIAGAEVYRLRPSSGTNWERHALRTLGKCLLHLRVLFRIDPSRSRPDANHLWIAGVPLTRIH